MCGMKQLQIATHQPGGVTVPVGEVFDSRLLVCTHSILIAYNCSRQQYYQQQLRLSTGFMRYRRQSDMPQVKCEAFSSGLSKCVMDACGIWIVVCVCVCEKDRKKTSGGVALSMAWFLVDVWNKLCVCG